MTRGPKPNQITMARFFKTLWRGITFPFVIVYRIIIFPFQAMGRFIEFLNTDPEDHPLMDTFNAIASEPQARQSLWDHIEDLRGHLLRTILGIAAAVGVSFTFTLPLMGYLSGPVGGLTNLQAIEVTEEIGVYMRVALTSGITIALPYIALELWLFAAPGLKSRERKFGLFGIPVASLLFLGGVAFTFYILLPAALPFLGGFTTIKQFWTAKEYFGFITGLMVWIGLFFEFPLIIYILTSLGLVKPSILAKQWRLAIVVIAVIAAAVTPTIDPVNMGLVMLPMTLLYFVSIGLSYIAYAGRLRNERGVDESVKQNQAQA